MQSFIAAREPWKENIRCFPHLEAKENPNNEDKEMKGATF